MSSNCGKVDAVLFDVDGTLWDSTPIVEKAWNRALRDNNIEDITITADQLKGLFGLPMNIIIDTILPGYPEDFKLQFAPQCYSYEHDFLQKEPGVLYANLEEALSQLSRMTRLFVVSNCQAGYIELLFDKTGFAKYFTGHICFGDNGLSKAENIQYICREYGIEHPLYVGDTIMDYEACRKAECPFVLAAYGFGKVATPDYVIKEPMDLVDIVRDAM